MTSPNHSFQRTSRKLAAAEFKRWAMQMQRAPPQTLGNTNANGRVPSFNAGGRGRARRPLCRVLLALRLAAHGHCATLSAAGHDRRRSEGHLFVTPRAKPSPYLRVRLGLPVLRRSAHGRCRIHRYRRWSLEGPRRRSRRVGLRLRK